MSIRFPRWSCLLVALLATMVVVLAPSRSHASEGTKFAVIDLARALADTEDGIRMKAELQELYDARQLEYDGKEKAVADAKAEYDALVKEGKTKDSVLRKKYASLEKMAYDLQVAQYKYRQEMQTKEYNLMQPILKQMLTLVRRLASQNGYDMVLNKEAVPYHRSDLEITDRVVQMYNAEATAKPEETQPLPKKKKEAPKEPTTEKKVKGKKGKGGSGASAKAKRSKRNR